MDDGSSQERDPNRVRNQPALHTPKKLIWLIPGLLLAIAAVWALTMSLDISPGFAWIGIAFVVAAAVAMIVTALTVRDDRQRNLILAGLMAIMAAVALVILIAIIWANAASGG